MRLPEAKKGDKLLVGLKKEDEQEEREPGVPIARLTPAVRTLASVPIERVWHSEDRVTCG